MNLSAAASVPDVAPPQGPLLPLLMEIAPVTPETGIADVGARMLESRHDALLSLPVVDAHGRPQGCISRYELMRIFLMPYGREVYGRRAIQSLMNPQPLVLDIGMSIAEAARRIGEGITGPITEDFILTDADGRYLGVGVVLSVLRATQTQLANHSTELEQAYARLKRSQAQLIQSEKMASLGQMVAGLAHEINTPLGYVRNNVEMLRTAQSGVRALIDAQTALIDATAQGAGADRCAGAMRAVQDARAEGDAELLDALPELFDDTLHGIVQIGDLVANLKDFSRLDQARRERVDPHALIESALKITAHVLRQSGIATVRDFGELPQLECVPQQINQVLLNLLTNAAQAIEHDHGRILVSTRCIAQNAVIAVEDNGKGIPEAHLKRIFDPFFTTKPVGKGTGLGLSICYQIMQQHAGTIRVASRPGAGTRFMLVLPLRSGEQTP